MISKSFFNNGQALVLDSLEGLCAVSPELVFHRGIKTIANAHHDPSRHVTLISGGGAGHEPAHAGFVGRGLLSGAVSGNVFASPSVSQIVEAVRLLGGSAGTILIVKNYTGDIFHFHLAAEKARAQWGHRVEVLVVGDDVAVGRKRSGKVGRRGLAGTVLVHKILGALSSEGSSVDEILAIGRQVVEGLATCGVSQGHVHIPGTVLQDGPVQLELGMGIHNEPGCHVLEPRPSLDGLLDRMLDMLVRTDDTDRAYVDFSGSSPVLMVNNLGATSQLELTAILHHVVSLLGRRGIKPARVLCGTFMSSLDAPGFSLTLLKATPTMISALDAPTSALGWPRLYSNFRQPQDARVVPSAPEKTRSVLVNTSGPKINAAAFTAAVTGACRSLLAAEPLITHDDSIVGDGDCGATLSRGAKAVLQTISATPVDDSTSASSAVMRVARAVEDSMDGTSGALYELFFTALAATLQTLPGEKATVQTWAQAAQCALERLQAMTPARVGDRTLMDALVPFVSTLADGDVARAVDAARKGRDATRGMEASLGRAVYVAGENWAKVADPGSEGVVSIVEGILEGL